MATSNTGVIIKRSFATAIPPYLEPGELAYSYVSNTFFIGSPSSDGVLNVGGQYYAQTLDDATSNNTPNTLVKRDANGNFSGSLSTIDGLVPGYYGGQTAIPVIQVAANGRIMSVSNTAITQPDSANLVNGIYKLSLGSDGKLTFPDNTLQNTAFTGTAVDQVARDLANNSSSGSAIDQYARETANSSITGSAIDQYARTKANTDVTNISLVGSSIGSSTQIPVIGYAANGRIISAGVASPQIGTGSVRGVVQLNDSVSSTSSVSGANAATPLAVKTTYDYAQSSFNQANISSTLAQAAFDKANVAAAGSTDQYARDTANTAISNITVLQGVNLTQNNDISILYATNLTQNNSITSLQGVNTTQNTRITSADDLARSAFGQANAAFTQANVGVAFINTGGTVTGNVSFTKDVTVTGNLNVLGNTVTVSVTEFVVDDPLLYLGANNYTSDIVDIGIIGNYNDGINAHTGIFRDPNRKEWIFFKGYTPEVESNNLIDLTHPSFRYANVYADVFKGNLIGSSVVVNGLDLYSYTTSSFSKSNTVGTLAQAAFDVANTVSANTIYTQGVDETQNTNITAINTYVTGAYNKANSANVLAQAAFDKANTAAAGSFDQYARDTANTATSNITVLQGVNTTQNTNITAVNNYATSGYAQANTADTKAQAAFDVANTDVTHISIAGSSVGSSTQIPVIGYAANGRIISTGVATPQTGTGLVRGVVQLDDSTSSTLGVSGANAATPLAVKTTYDFAQAAYNVANTNASNITIIQGVNTTQNTNISAVNTFAGSAYDKANTADEKAQAAFDVANTAAAVNIDQYARDIANTASANSVYTQGVDATQNTNITAINTFAGSAYNQANTTDTKAQAAFNVANTALANTIYTQGVDETQNTNISAVNNYATSAYGKANTSDTKAQAAFDTANTNASNITVIQGVNLTQNTNITAVNTFAASAYNQANTADTKAQAAFDTSNTKLNITGGTVTGDISFTGANVALGNIANVHIYGGNTGQLLTTDNFGNLSFIDLPTPNTVTYTANSLIQTNGVYVSGNLWSTQVFGDYATSNGAYVLTDGTGSAPAWYIDFDFINVVKFNRVVMNINYTQSSGHTIYVQLYNNTTSTWDSIGTYTGLGSYYAFALEVIDEFAYLDAGRVQLRLYHSNQGNASHQTSIDYIALEQSYQGPQGPRGPTGATGATGATGNGVSSGGTTGQVLIKNSSTNYDTVWSNNLIDAWNTSNSAYIQANTATTLAQAAFDKANTGISSSIDQYARDTANTASANTIYTQGVNDTQNTNITAVNTFAGGAYDKANTADIKAQAAFDKANTAAAGSTDQYARDTANTAASNITVLQGVDVTQNAAITILQNVNLTQNSSITVLQGVNTTQNTNITAVNTYATSAYGKANSANVLAQAAFDSSNTRVLKAGDTITGTLNVNATIASTKPNTGTLIVNGGVGVSDSIYVGNRVGFSNTSNVSMVYQYYNASTNSLDTVFG